MTTTTRTSTNVTAPDAIGQCPECAGRLFHDDRRGEDTCSACGLVVDENVPAPHGWPHAYDSREQKTRWTHGPACQPLDLILPTTFVPSPGMASTTDWLRLKSVNDSTCAPSFNRFLVTRGSYSRTNDEIKGLAVLMHLPPGVVDAAKYTNVKIRRASRVNRGLQVDALAAACIYRACRDKGTPLAMDAISAASGCVSTHEIYVTLRETCRLLKTLPRAQALQPHVRKAGSALGVPDRIVAIACRWCARLPGSMLYGHKAAGVAAAMLYMACKKGNVPVTQHEVARAAGVTSVTLRTRMKDMKGE